MSKSDTASLPLVSAVIPTRNRPELVRRAVRSALDQTYPNLEVVVVVDGPDPATVEALHTLHESRLRVIALAENVGGSEARNIGAREAAGDWIAFLDDDDEWLPNKIDLQMSAAHQAQKLPIIIASQYIERGDKGDIVRPQNFQRQGQPISEYLFCEIPAIRPRQGFPQTSTLLTQKSLLAEIQFTRGLRRNQDSDWLLRAVPKAGGVLHFVPSVLAIFHNPQDNGRISRNLDWRDSYDWCIRNRALFTDKAFSFYLAAFCLPAAMRKKEGAHTAAGLLRDCYRNGAITPKVLWLFLRHGFIAPILKQALPRGITGTISRAMYK